VPLRTLLVGKYGSRCLRRRTRLLAHCLHLGAHHLTLLGGHLGATLAHLRAQLSPLLRRHLLTALLHLRASCGALLRRELRPLRHVLLHPGACRRELLLLLIANCFQLRDLVGSELQGLPFREHGRGYTTAHAHALTGRVLWLLCLRVQRRQHQCQRYDILSHRVLPRIIHRVLRGSVQHRRSADGLRYIPGRAGEQVLHSASTSAASPTRRCYLEGRRYANSTCLAVCHTAACNRHG